MAGSQPVDTTPIDTADPLLAHTLRAGLESFIRGDYHAALERLKDARAVGRLRADMAPFRLFEDALELALEHGAIVTHGAAPAVSR